MIRRRERHVGLAERDRPGRPQACDGIGIAMGKVIRQMRKAAGRRHSAHFVRILDGDRQPVKRTARIARGAIGRASGGSCPLDVQGNHGIQCGVHALEARELQVEQLQRAELARPEQAKKGSRRTEFGRELVFVVHADTPERGYRRSYTQMASCSRGSWDSSPCPTAETGTQFIRQAERHSECAATASASSADGIE